MQEVWVNEYKDEDILQIVPLLPENHIVRAMLECDPDDTTIFRSFVKEMLSLKMQEIIMETRLEDLPTKIDDEEIISSPFYKWRFVIGK